MPQYLGVLDNRDTAHALASATVNLDFKNNSRFDAVVNNTLSVYYNTKEKRKSEVQEEFPSIFTFEQIPKEITQLLKKTPLYKQGLNRIRHLVKEKHTFHHELAKTFKQASLPDESDRILKDLEKRW